MLIFYSILRACILLAGDTWSLYVDTMISVIYRDQFRATYFCQVSKR